MLPLEQPDRIDVAFDDHSLVANAGLILPVTLVHHLDWASWLTAILTWAVPLAVPTRGQGADPSGIGAGRWRLHCAGG